MVTPDLAFGLELKNVIKLSWDLLTPQERTRVGFLAIIMVINGFLQTFSLALLIPFIGLMLDPLALQKSARFAEIHRMFGDVPPQALLIWCALALLSAVVFKDLFEYAYIRYQNRLIANVERRVSVDLLSKCMLAPYEWFLSNSSARLSNAIMAHVVTWARAGLKGVLSMTSSGVLMVSIIMLLVSINPMFGLVVAFLGGALGFAMIGLVKRRVRRLAAIKHDAHDETFKILNDALNGYKDVKINGRESFFVHQYSQSQSVYAHTEASLNSIQSVPKYTVEVVIALILVSAGLIVSAYTDARAEMAAVLAVYGAAAVRMVPIFNQVSSTVGSIHAAVPAIWNIRRTQLELAELASRQVESTVSGHWNSIQVDAVAYIYPGATAPALDGISLVIERGMRLGVVGRSGAGKTTLVDVLSGLLCPSSGRVVIGDRVLDQGGAQSWRKQIGYVPQNTFIVEGTLRFNVTLETDAKQIDDEKVLVALRVANLSDLLARELTDGLDAGLGDKGNRLSGGQRQRVAIARALYRDPSLIIFDEATSSLDAESENEISQALSRISREKTLLVIAHRLSTVKDCDRIVVLDKGRIIGFDTHENLIRSCPLYRRFVELGDLSAAAPDDLDLPVAESSTKACVS
jgi:ABC-type multidrug transport system fused ATPase/permease subunit